MSGEWGITNYQCDLKDGLLCGTDLKGRGLDQEVQITYFSVLVNEKKT